MTNDALTSMPASIAAGDLITWRLSLSDYPASDGWAISYALVKDGVLIPIATAADGDDHVATITVAQSLAFATGVYRFQQYATKTPDRRTIDSGQVEITPDFASQTDGIDARSDAEIRLATLWVTYDKLAAKHLASKSGGTSSVTDKALADIRVEIEKEQATVAREKRREKRRKGKRTGRKVLTRFR